MSFSMNKKWISASAGVGIAGIAALASHLHAEEPISEKNNSCGDVNLVSIGTSGHKSSATYHYVACVKDQFGKTTVTDGEFRVDAENAWQDHVVAALGEGEADRIGSILESLDQHLDSAPAVSDYYIHDMACEPTVALKGVENIGGIRFIELEVREEFVNAMAWTSGCKVTTELVLPNEDFNDKRFTEETNQQIHDLQKLIAQPMSFNP